MIDDSVPWKRDLFYDTVSFSRRLARFKKSPREWPSEDLVYRIERFCMLTAFIVRRLIESEKLSTELERTTFAAIVYPKRTLGYQPLDFLTRGDIDKRFVLDQSSERNIQTLVLANLFIHSADLVVGIDELKRLSCFVTSAKHSRQIWQVGLKEIVRLGKAVAKDDVVSAEYHRDPITGAMISRVRSRKRSPHERKVDDQRR